MTFCGEKATALFVVATVLLQLNEPSCRVHTCYSSVLLIETRPTKQDETLAVIGFRFNIFNDFSNKLRHDRSAWVRPSKCASIQNTTNHELNVFSTVCTARHSSLAVLSSKSIFPFEIMSSHIFLANPFYFANLQYADLTNSNKLMHDSEGIQR